MQSTCFRQSIFLVSSSALYGERGIRCRHTHRFRFADAMNDIKTRWRCPLNGLFALERMRATFRSQTIIFPPQRRLQECFPLILSPDNGHCSAIQSQAVSVSETVIFVLFLRLRGCDPVATIPGQDRSLAFARSRSFVQCGSVRRLRRQRK